MAEEQTKPSLEYLIYQDLYDAVTGIASKIFFERPATSDTSMEDFIVIDLPTEIRGRFAGNSDVLVDCYATFSLFCKAKKDRTPYLEKQTGMVQQIKDKFPIDAAHVSATKPTVLMQGYDGYGYQVTQISFKLRTKLNARDVTEQQTT